MCSQINWMERGLPQEVSAADFDKAEREDQID